MKYIILLLTAAGLFACKKNNVGPAENYTEDYIFSPLDKNGIAAQQALSNIYADMPTGFNRIGGDLLDAASDDALPSRNGTTIQQVIDANLNSSSHPDGNWTKNYAAIRKVNLFLKNIDVVPKPDEIKFWKAEARFLRALFYFELVKRYGGVPIVGDTVFNSADNIQLPRSSFDACINYIINECDNIKTAVRQEPISNTDWGRASRGAVLALKARVLLYAASPLYNGGVPAEASAAQKPLLGYATYDAERWNKAAIAANDLLALNLYPLEAAQSNNFLNRKNNETILSFLRNTTTDLEVNNGPVGYKENGTGNGATSPTQDLVDAFTMLNGKAITETGSGYDANAPYNNRDPRLAGTVLRDGSAWLNRPVETFDGGLDRPNKAGVQTKTGYYLRKFLGNFATSTQYNAQNHNFVLFRTAELMLNYAEALNEYSGPVTAVYTQLFNLRKRAGITAGADNRYGIAANLTKEQLRELIRNERRVELAFEEHRYWDIRRWKIAPQVLNKDLTGIRITKTGTTTSYQKVSAGRNIFIAPKMYYYAIPYSELAKNTALLQNPGW